MRKEARHARDVIGICPNRHSRVSYYEFAPQGSGETESLTPLKRRTIHLADLSDHRWKHRSSRLSKSAAEFVQTTAARRFDKRTERAKLEKLPFWDAVRCFGGSVRSLRTQQRALVKCQITSTLLRQGEIPLDQSPALWCRHYGLSVMASFLVSSNSLRLPYSGGRMHFFFTESLILAQDERWRRA